MVDGGGGHWLVPMEWLPAGWLVSASVYLPLHHKVQKFSSGTGSPGWSWKNGHKMVVMMLVAYVLSRVPWNRAGSVFKLKPKLQFLVKTKPKPKPRFWRGPTWFWGRTRLTEDMAHSLNDEVFKFFLIATDRQTDRPHRLWRSWPHWV